MLNHTHTNTYTVTEMGHKQYCITLQQKTGKSYQKNWQGNNRTKHKNSEE